jgi:ribosomal protein S18 acetylase RimI-like enzyme
MIRIARLEDINQIMLIVSETIEDLNSENNHQWSETYPTEVNFTEDINNKALYIFEKSGQVAGFICINQQEDEAYKELNWNCTEPAIVIHRFAVRRSHQRQSIGTKLLEYIESFARNKDIFYLKVDTNSKNTRMNKLFQKQEYNFIGTINLRGLNDKFNCYDKVLEREV